MDFYSTKFRNWISFQPHQQYNETETINSNIVHVWYTYNNIGSIIELWMAYLNFLSHAIHHLFCINVLEIRKYIWFNWEWALHSQRPENSLLMLQGSNSCPPDITQRVFTSRLASKQGYIFLCWMKIAIECLSISTRYFATAARSQLCPWYQIIIVICGFFAVDAELVRAARHRLLIMAFNFLYLPYGCCMS